MYSKNVIWKNILLGQSNDIFPRYQITKYSESKNSETCWWNKMTRAFQKTDETILIYIIKEQ